MLATRKLDLKLIEKLLPQLEDEEIQAEIALEIAENAAYLARQRRDEAHDHVLQMKGEYESAQELARPPILLGPESLPDPNPDLKDGKTSKVFWETDGFSWRQFLPDFIGKGIPMTFNDIVAEIELTDEQAKRLHSTISSALSHLAKLGILKTYPLPGVRGVFYGVPSQFEGDELKKEFLDKIIEKTGRRTSGHENRFHW